MNWSRSTASTFVLAAALAACSKAPPPKVAEKCPVQKVTVSVLASKAINRSADGAPRPVVVRLYQLKEDARIFNASFEQVWKDEKTTLADDVVKMQELEVYPGTRMDVTFDRPPTVNHVVAVALFSNPTGRTWFSSQDLPPIPESGKCGDVGCAPGDEECESASMQAPHFVYWADGSKIDEGIEHLDDYPAPGRAKK